MSEGTENIEQNIDVYNLETMESLPRAEIIKLFSSNELLKNDPYSQAIVKNDFFITRGGNDIELNAGAFACLRIAMLEQMRASNTMELGQRRNPIELEAAMVIHSGDRIVDRDGVADTQ